MLAALCHRWTQFEFLSRWVHGKQTEAGSMKDRADQQMDGHFVGSDKT